MHQIYRTFIVAALLIFFPLSLPASTLNNPSPALISVSAEGSAKAQPDQAELLLHFSHEALEVEDARKTVDQHVRKTLKMLEDFDLTSGSLDSSQTHIQPQYTYHQGQRTFRAYQVTRNVRFVLGNLDQLEELIQKISRLDISRLQHVQMGLSNPGLVKQEALDQAIQRSKLLAQHIAEQYDAKLGKVHSVRYHAQGAQAPRPMMSMRAEMATDSAPSYEQQDLEFTAHIEVSFTLD
ncbi:MAG: SIMPL domain-containing protein [Oleiphilaceae bacterium]|nr:SIMPL domain-containing protein [Oleiphilaceae bacterium]